MKRVEQFLRQLVAYAAYGALIAVVIVWLPSEVFWMRAVGAVVLVFLLMRFWQLKNSGYNKVKN